MKNLVAAGIAGALVFLGGCATHGQGEDWWKMDARSFSFMTPGKTTKAEVERQIGAPLMTMDFKNLREQVWDYRYLNGTYVYAQELHFDEDGTLKYAVTYPDHCKLHPMPCR